MCKKCKKAFRKEVNLFEEADEYCPHCDNHYMIEAKTPETEGKLIIDIKMEKGHEGQVTLDSREKERGKTLQEAIWTAVDSDESDDDFKI